MNKPRPIPLQYCVGCNAILDSYPPGVPCPDRECRSLERTWKVGEPGAFYSKMRERHVRDGQAASKADLEIVRGEEIFRDGNEWRRLIRVIDRANDRYIELVIAADGSVVRQVDEPLSEHRGRGAAKKHQVGPGAVTQLAPSSRSAISQVADVDLRRRCHRAGAL